MNQADFDIPMGRLREQWPQAYSGERIRIIAREVGGMSPAWWAKTVDKLLGESRQVPLMSEIRTELAVERERNWSYQKSEYNSDAEQFCALANNSDARGMYFKTVIDRMNRKVPNEIWESFLQGLDKLRRGLNA